MKVTFEPHVGYHVHSGDKVEHNQYRVRIDGKHVGYVGKHQDAPVGFVRQMTSDEVVAVQAAVQRDLGWQPKTSQPVEIPESVRRQLLEQQGYDVPDEDDDDE